MASLRIVCLSDTHGMHREVEVPEGDVLIHAGDLTSFFQPLEDSMRMLGDVNDWLGGLPHRHRIVIAGNHDLVFQQEPKKARTLLTHAHYLENSGIELEGLRFWGSPHTPVIEAMAFAIPANVSSRTLWERIPSATDVLITHGPPFGNGDKPNPLSGHHGDLHLLQAVMRVAPRLHVFGHIHGGYGRESNGDGTWFVNCAVVDNRRRLAHPPIVVDLSV